MNKSTIIGIIGGVVAALVLAVVYAKQILFDFLNMM